MQYKIHELAAIENHTTKEQERAELHRAIWQIANDLRGNFPCNFKDPILY